MIKGGGGGGGREEKEKGEGQQQRTTVSLKKINGHFANLSGRPLSLLQCPHHTTPVQPSSNTQNVTNPFTLYQSKCNILPDVARRIRQRVEWATRHHHVLTISRVMDIEISKSLNFPLERERERGGETLKAPRRLIFGSGLNVPIENDNWDDCFVFDFLRTPTTGKGNERKG